MATQWHLAFADGSNTGAVRYGMVTSLGNNGGNFNATEAAAQIPWAAAGNFRSARIFLATAPNTGNSWRFQLCVNGTESTVIDITISDAATSGSVTGDVAINAGDLVSWTVTPSSTPDANAKFELWLEWDPTTANQFVYGGVFGQGAAINLGGRFNPLFTGYNDTLANLATATNATSVSLSPIAGTITDFRVALDAAPTAGNSWDFSIYKDGSDIGSLLSIADAATTGSQTGLAHAVSVLSRMGFHIVTRNGTPTDTRVAWSVIFVPTTAGQFCLTGSDTTSAAADNYWMPQGGGAGHETHSTTEADVQVRAPAALAIKAVTYRLTNAPGVTGRWTVSSAINGTTGNNTIALGNVAEGSDVAHTDTLVQDQLINIECLETTLGAAAMGAHAWGMGFGPSSVDVVPDPVVVEVSVVAPALVLALTVGPVVAEVSVVAPSISLISYEPNEVWVETWDTQEP